MAPCKVLRWTIGFGLVVGPACSKSVFDTAGVGAGGKSETLRARTALGSPITWPAGFDIAGVHGRPSYSPSGTRLAFSIGTNNVGVLDFSTRQVWDVASHYGAERGYGDAVWISDEVLRLRESWQTPEQMAAMQADPPVVQMEFADRVIDIHTGETLSYSPLGSRPSMSFLSALDAQRFLVYERPYANRIRVYRSDTNQFEGTVATENNPNEEILHGPICAPWIVKMRGAVDDSGQPVPFGAPIDLEYTNMTTGLTRLLGGFPRPCVYGVLVTSDGRWVASAYYDQGVGLVPVIVDTQTQRRVDLPDESWAPVALSETRGMLLVVLADVAEDGTLQRSWYEIPLSALLRE